MVVMMLTKGFCGIFAFPCSTILLTNSASTLRVLGTLNGVATSISAVGRAAGPALAGVTFSAGVDIGYVVISWWTLAVVGVIGAVPVWGLVEMEGFATSSSDDDDDDKDDDSGEDDDDDDAAEDGYGFDDDDYDENSINDEQGRFINADADGRTAKTSSISSGGGGGAHARETRPRRSSSHTSTTMTNDVFEADDDRDRDHDHLLPGSGSLSPITSRGSQPRPRQRSSHRELRRIASPIGLGVGVIPTGSRRYSSDLGATRSGLGVGGTSFN